MIITKIKGINAKQRLASSSFRSYKVVWNNKGRHYEDRSKIYLGEEFLVGEFLRRDTTFGERVTITAEENFEDIIKEYLNVKKIDFSEPIEEISILSKESNKRIRVKLNYFERTTTHDKS